MTMNNRLSDLRKQIDVIDEQLLDLITQRSALLHQVLAEKINATKSGNTKIFVPAREQEIIDRLVARNKSALSAEAITTIFQSIISACRNFQITNNKINNEAFVISVQGVVGSFSEAAAIKFCQQKTLTNYIIDYAVSSDGVLSCVTSGKTVYGVVALNNAQGGLVAETITAFSQYQYRIIDSVIISVEHSLMALPGTMKSQIKNIYSHPQALKQCHQYLQDKYLDCELIPWVDTAQAAIDLAAGKLADNSAIIAHARCAEKNKLQLLDEKIQDLQDNETLFLVITGHANHAK